jgi:DNA-binding transcriptional LysR family regulator
MASMPSMPEPDRTELTAGAAIVKLNQVDLNLLVALNALLTERNVTKAAETLYIGQPAMSASLARLRRVFDDPLLVRNGRSLTLTPLAQSLLRPLQEILAGIEDVLTLRPEFDPAHDNRLFTVVGSDYVTLILLRRLLEVLDAEAPKVTVRIEPLAVGFQSRLEQGGMELLLLPKEVDESLDRFPHRPLFEDRWVAAVWDGHADINEPLTREVFCQVPHMAYNPHPLPSLAESHLRQLGIERNIEVTTETFVLAPLLIRGTHLMAVVHERIARELAPLAHCRILELPFAMPAVTESMYWHPRYEDDPAHRWLRERIAALAGTV